MMILITALFFTTFWFPAQPVPELRKDGREEGIKNLSPNDLAHSVIHCIWSDWTRSIKEKSYFSDTIMTFWRLQILHVFCFVIEWKKSNNLAIISGKKRYGKGQKQLISKLCCTYSYLFRRSTIKLVKSRMNVCASNSKTTGCHGIIKNCG